MLPMWIATWMVQFRFEELDQFQFVGTQFTVVIDVSKWRHEVSIKILSGMPQILSAGSYKASRPR